MIKNGTLDGFEVIPIEIENKEKGFYDDIVVNLRNEAKNLNKKLRTIREMNLRDDYNNYITVLKSLRETLDLIHKYDWQLMYSEYGVLRKTGLYQDKEELFTEIAVWEQNHDSQIRNHKTWKTFIPYGKPDSDRVILGELKGDKYNIKF